MIIDCFICGNIFIIVNISMISYEILRILLLSIIRLMYQMYINSISWNFISSIMYLRYSTMIIDCCICGNITISVNISMISYEILRILLLSIMRLIYQMYINSISWNFISYMMMYLSYWTMIIDCCICDKITFSVNIISMMSYEILRILLL
jgi:hypothetical protein